MSARCDVLIAGAGPAGSASAIRLARAGLDVCIVDRARFPRQKICSEYLSPEGVRHLALLGALARIEREGGQAIRGTTVHAARGASLTGFFARAGHPPFRDTGLSVSRWILDHALLDAARAAGARVLESTAVEGLLGTPSGIGGLRVRHADGRRSELPARLTVGADGLHSVVARGFGRRRYGRLRRYALAAHFQGMAGLGETAELIVSPEGYVGVNPLGGGLANVALVVPRALVAAARGRPRRFFLETVERFPRMGPRLRGARIVRDVMTTGPFAAWSGRVVAPEGGALLVGDAADFFDPFTGEGICAALRGAELLEPVVREALDRPGAVTPDRLLPYAAARRRAFLGKWMVERAIGYAMLAPAFFDRAVRRLERRGLAHTLIGVTGDFVPASAVLNPVFLSQVVF